MGHQGQDNVWSQQPSHFTTGIIAVTILGTCVSTSQPMLTPYAYKLASSEVCFFGGETLQ